MSEEDKTENIEQEIEKQAEEIAIEGVDAEGENAEDAELDKRESKAKYFFAA